MGAGVGAAFLQTAVDLRHVAIAFRAVAAPAIHGVVAIRQQDHEFLDARVGGSCVAKRRVRAQRREACRKPDRDVGRAGWGHGIDRCAGRFQIGRQWDSLGERAGLTVGGYVVGIPAEGRGAVGVVDLIAIADAAGPRGWSRRIRGAADRGVLQFHSPTKPGRANVRCRDADLSIERHDRHFDSACFGIHRLQLVDEIVCGGLQRRHLAHGAHRSSVVEDERDFDGGRWARSDKLFGRTQFKSS